MSSYEFKAVRNTKGFNLTKWTISSSVVAILMTTGLVSYDILIKKADVSVLKNAVMINVELVQSHYDNNGYWITDLTEELKAQNLASKNFSDEFTMEIFDLEGFPYIIAREKVNEGKYGIEVSYYFKTHELVVKN
ncbi:MAG: hypothetical protein KAS62_09485 [Candidatus Delongbacteria bacterium]|nr:hypothetical protein [Candidatus Delongbacteria bacterium]